jgi:tetratricopeptide (TPR) repeat protein
MTQPTLGELGGKTLNFLKSGEYEKAAESYIEMAKHKHVGYHIAAEYYKLAAYCYRKIGKDNLSNELFRKALDEYEKTIPYFKEDLKLGGLDREFNLNWTRKRIADCYAKLREKQKADKIYRGIIDYLKNRLTVKAEVGGWRGEPTKKVIMHLPWGGVEYEMLAMIYQKLGEYDKALEFCNKAENEFSKYPQPENITDFEPYYLWYARDFIEELIDEGMINLAEVLDLNFGKLDNFKLRASFRRKLIELNKQREIQD